MKKTARKAVAPAISTPILPPTIIEFLLDETGSMSRFLSQTIAGFQNFIDEQRTLDGLCLFTLSKFDTAGLKNPYIDLDINMVPYLTTDTFVPGGGTNLYDTIVSRIAARKAQLSTWDIKPRVLFVVMTDGEDNASRTSYVDARIKIHDAMEDEWTFVFLGAYRNADKIARTLGFPEGNIRCFEGAQMQETMQELGSATRAYRAAETTPSSFYATV